MTGQPIDTRTWRRIADTKIEQAILDGQFLNLPGFGQPLPSDFEQYDENWWIKRKAKLEGLSLLPPALELLKLVERRLAQIMVLDNEPAVCQSVAKLNAEIVAANMKIAWGPPSRTIPLQVDTVVRLWRERRDARESQHDEGHDDAGQQ